MTRYVNYQARAATIQDNIRRKLIKNQASLIGIPEEIISIKTTKNRDGDIITRIVNKALTANVVFPPMTDVPIRYLKKDDHNVWSITSLISAFAEDNQQIYTVTSDNTLDVDDIIVRTFLMNDKANVVCLEVKEVLATFGGNSIISNNYKVALYTQDLPQQMVDIIVDFAKRRQQVQY